MAFRFEYYENVINKHHRNKVDWKQAAINQFYDKLNKADVTIASVKMIDEDTLEIIKRIDQNRSFKYNMGLDQYGLYERVYINRKDCSVATDRMDVNWWINEPYLGRRELFYVSEEDKQKLLETGNSKHQRLTMVQHDFWLNKIWKVPTCLWSNLSAMSYKRAFRAQKLDL